MRSHAVVADRGDHLLFHPALIYSPADSLVRSQTSFSDFHPGSYNPAWSVSNILVGLLSLWTSEEMTTGGMNATPQARKTLAARSHAFNVTQVQFKKVFPEYAADRERTIDLPNMGSNGSSSSSTSSQATAVASAMAGNGTAAATAQNPNGSKRE